MCTIKEKRLSLCVKTFKIRREATAHVHKISCEGGGASVTYQEEIPTRVGDLCEFHGEFVQFLFF